LLLLLLITVINAQPEALAYKKINALGIFLCRSDGIF
jgi:hypothetical protein